MNKSILVAALVAVALTACGKKEEPKAAAPAPAEHLVVLHVLILIVKVRLVCLITTLQLAEVIINI